MKKTLLALLVAAPLGAVATDALATTYNTLSGSAPIVIGHRGASGYLPEHTLEAYSLAIAQGANYIEPDLVMTRDGVLIARHEPLLARVDLNADGTIKLVNGAPVINRTDTSTNVWQLDKYADRLTVKTVDGQKVAGWFAEDFTAAEIRADIRTQERLRDLRTANNAYNDQYVIPTLQEVIDLAKAKSIETGRTIGIYPETKHPTYFKNFTDANGLPRMEDVLVQTLHANYGNDANAPVYIQSFEVSNLQYINSQTDIRIAQLLNGSGRPYDFVVSGDGRTYAQLAELDAEGLAFIREYADGIGANTNLIIPLVAGELGTPTSLIDDAHSLELEVHAWTFRAENIFLPNEFDSSSNPAAFGDMKGQIRVFLELGLDGFFTDHPDLGVAAVASIPEPETWAMLLAGLGLIGAAARRRKN
ncbi:glycerophosphodiester phosphodiesterase family protein [Methyloversatilis thermotolerans]|uniref:glycerophosphodiester phosphodiesterase family protein n=1 Tax=Methyloversatilis thermotolerans TaxID=1346290 RepID=UPI0004769219|nr:glycerophosphodiester phosphodiesterase family protein [Methyloversatilis thermotolerans]